MKTSTTKRYVAREKFENQILNPADLIYVTTIVELENDSNRFFRLICRAQCIYNQFHTCIIDGQKVLIIVTDHPNFLKTLQSI